MHYRQVNVFSGKGPETHQFTTALRGITLDEEGRVYAVGDSEVKVFESDGTLVRRWSTSRPGFSVAVAGPVIYVGQEGQVELFAPTGRLTATWRDPEFFGRVTAIDFVEGYVLAADSNDRCIRRFDSQGSFVNNIGKENRMKGFNIPNGILDFAVDRDGIIHACNPGKHRVERYTADGQLLGHIGRFDGRNPQGFPGCCNPTNVTVTDQGLVYVTEKAGPRAKVYDFEGQLLAVIANDIFDPNCSNMDLAVDSQGRVFVVDTVRLRIHTFEPHDENG